MVSPMAEFNNVIVKDFREAVVEMFEEISKTVVRRLSWRDECMRALNIFITVVKYKFLFADEFSKTCGKTWCDHHSDHEEARLSCRPADVHTRDRGIMNRLLC